MPRIQRAAHRAPRGKCFHENGDAAYAGRSLRLTADFEYFSGQTRRSWKRTCLSSLSRDAIMVRRMIAAALFPRGQCWTWPGPRGKRKQANTCFHGPCMSAARKKRAFRVVVLRYAANRRQADWRCDQDAKTGAEHPTTRRRYGVSGLSIDSQSRGARHAAKFSRL